MKKKAPHPVHELKEATESLSKTLETHFSKHNELVSKLEQRDAAFMALINYIGGIIQAETKGKHPAMIPLWAKSISACLLAQTMPYPTPQMLKKVEEAKKRLKVQVDAILAEGNKK